ncbi:MAG: hypothetical protein K2O14_12875, partial [Oscillospiraceae bacterium]|nr:hypothetical protein [Oscillospiraceae bacterium]
PAPPPPPKSEMETLAERLSDILGKIPDIKPAKSAEKVKESTKADSENGQAEAAVNDDKTPREKIGDDTENDESTAAEKAVSPDVIAQPAEADKEAEGGDLSAETAPAEGGAGNAENAAPSAVLPAVMEIADVSVDFSIDG